MKRHICAVKRLLEGANKLKSWFKNCNNRSLHAPVFIIYYGIPWKYTLLIGKFIYEIYEIHVSSLRIVWRDAFALRFNRAVLYKMSLRGSIANHFERRFCFAFE